MAMIKLILTDDHEIFTKGLEKVLSAHPYFQVIAACHSGADLLSQLPGLSADILLLDIQLPDYEPETLLQQIRHLKPQLPILYLTMMRGSRHLHKLEKYNIQGYILKDAAIEELENAIHQVATGGTYFSQELAVKETFTELNTTTIPSNKLADLLSKREYEILKLVCEEYSSAEIGEKLFLSTGTVDTHRRNILVKLGVSNTVGLVKFAIHNGILNE